MFSWKCIKAQKEMMMTLIGLVLVGSFVKVIY